MEESIKKLLEDKDIMDILKNNNIEELLKGDLDENLLKNLMENKTFNDIVSQQSSNEDENENEDEMEEEHEFYAEDKVKTINLKNEEYNNKEGIVEDYDYDKKRYIVIIGDKLLAIKEENLELITPTIENID